MKIHWKITSHDIRRIQTFVSLHDNQFVQNRVSKNVEKKGVQLTKDVVLKAMIMCLITSQQRSGPNTPIARFLRMPNFPFRLELLEKHSKNLDIYIRDSLSRNQINRFQNRIVRYFLINYEKFRVSKWAVLPDISDVLKSSTKEKERTLASRIQKEWLGFGPKQSRNFLQYIGVTKFEVPIDSRVINWINEFGFPFKLSSIALQDPDYYNIVLDGIQELCEKAGVLTCILDAAIFSSYDSID